jgi:DNA polymerase
MGKDRTVDLWPWNAPGMPPPGPDFLRQAMDLGDDTVLDRNGKREGTYVPGAILQGLYRRALREVGFTLDVEVRQGRLAPVTFVPGHIWGQHAEEWARSLADPTYEAPRVDGPRPADVLILGKMPWREETREGRNLVGASGEVLVGLLRELRVRGADRWYVTNLCKFMPPEDAGASLRASWVRDCLPLLAQELRLVRPRYILCLGSDASKWLLGERFNISYMAGRVVPYTFRVNRSADEPPEFHTAQVMAVLHPAEVSRSPEKSRILQSNLSRFSLLLQGHDFTRAEHGIDHRAYYRLEEAEEWAREADAFLSKLPPRERLVGIDAEWHGRHPMNPGSRLRTVQLSWAEKKSACFVITTSDGRCAFLDRKGRPAVRRLLRLLQRFMRGKRAVGHFFVSDLEWLTYYGFDPVRSCPVPLYASPDGRTAWQRLRDGEGWLDTAYMHHAIEETAPLGLEMLAMRYTTAPRYDIALEDALREYCKERGISRESLEGFGELPDEIIVPYANYDADVPLRSARAMMPLLDRDYEGHCVWEPFWESMVAQKAILTIHQNGILVDRQRVDLLTRNFLTARAAQEQKLQEWARWPEFNVRSTYQVREFLFGERLNGKRDADGRPVRLRPPGARSLYVEPLLDTSKPPRQWKTLRQLGLDRDATPATGKMVLGVLAQENLDLAEPINLLRDYRFLDQVLKSVLRPPRTDEDDHWVEDEDGFLEYDSGLAASLDSDGRVRTHLYATAETGRWKSRRPNLQNISKGRDPDYARLLGKENYRHKLRSVLRASPGFALIEFDYKGAELYGMALMSGSRMLQEHCVRANTYPERGYDVRGRKAKGCCPDNPGSCPRCGYPHPDYYDIHSHVAKMAFQLDCHPSKFGLELAGKGHFRKLAKSVIFGIAYGGGAKSIALQAREQGIPATPEQAQMVIDTIMQRMYPELSTFYAEVRRRAVEERWLCHCFGRYRRFSTAVDDKMVGEIERQAMNFPMQGMIASAVDRGLAFLVDAIERQGLKNDIRLLLQMHDAGLVEARYALVPYAKKLIHWAMVDMVEIWPTYLDGRPRGDGPYHLGLSFSVENHWGEEIPPGEYARLGIPTEEE